LVIFFAFALVPPTTSRWVDFPVYWAAGEKAIAGRTVYDVAGHFQYKYSPLIALIFGKLLLPLSFGVASWVFQKLMLALWAGYFLRCTKLNFAHALLLLLFFGNALRLDLALGQINALVALLLFGLFSGLEARADKKRIFLFAVLFSFAVQLKLFALILVPVLVLRREWAKLAASLVFLPLLSIGGVALHSGLDFALAENANWIRSLTASTDELLVDAQNVAILGTASKLFGLSVGKFLWLASGIAFLVFIAKGKDRPADWIRNRAFAAIAFLNPLVWSYWILFLVPLAAEILRDPPVALWKKRRWALAAAALYVWFAFMSQHAKWAWNGGILVAMALVAGIALQRDRKLSP
jgi:hypothetical protein